MDSVLLNNCGSNFRENLVAEEWEEINLCPSSVVLDVLRISLPVHERFVLVEEAFGCEPKEPALFDLARTVFTEKA